METIVRIAIWTCGEHPGTQTVSLSTMVDAATMQSPIIANPRFLVLSQPQGVQNHASAAKLRPQDRIQQAF
jgi:hypothetical protein